MRAQRPGIFYCLWPGSGGAPGAYALPVHQLRCGALPARASQLTRSRTETVRTVSVQTISAESGQGGSQCKKERSPGGTGVAID
jgi:hypothetical protein